MDFLTQCHLNKARISKQVLDCFAGSESIQTGTISVSMFQKALSDNAVFFHEDQINKFKEDIKKSADGDIALLQKGEAQLEDFTKISLIDDVGGTGIVNVWVHKDVVQKGGEGSKGGKVIGHTKSGKAIYGKHGNARHSKFNVIDHFDAADLHADIADNLNYPKEKEKYKYHTDQADMHYKSATKKEKN